MWPLCEIRINGLAKFAVFLAVFLGFFASVQLHELGPPFDIYDYLEHLYPDHAELLSRFKQYAEQSGLHFTNPTIASIRFRNFRANYHGHLYNGMDLSVQEYMKGERIDGVCAVFQSKFEELPKPSNFSNWRDITLSSCRFTVIDQANCMSCTAIAISYVVGCTFTIKKRLIVQRYQVSPADVFNCMPGSCLHGANPAAALGSALGRGQYESILEMPYCTCKGMCRSIEQSEIRPRVNILYKIQTEEELYARLNGGPIFIGFPSVVLRTYRAGYVISNYDCAQLGYPALDHAVTIVGYNASLNAYRVLNSWGHIFGAEGYFFIAAKENTCNFNQAMYALDLI